MRFFRDPTFIIGAVIAVIAWMLVKRASGAECRIAWDASPGATEYRVWRGIDMMVSVTSSSASVDLPADQLSTLTVTARNESGESVHSEPLTVLPVTPQSTTNLSEWNRHPPFFITAKPSAFFRLTYSKP